MVHARDFSFSDESTNVRFPQTKVVTQSMLDAIPDAGPRRMETALHHFRIREIQSAWYEELFQCSQASSGKSHDDPARYQWSVLCDMRAWSESIPKSTSATIKNQLELEALYSCVYALAPSERV